MLGVCPTHGPYTSVYVERVSFCFPLFFCTRSTYGRVLGVCPIHGPYMGVYVGRVSSCFPLISYTVLVHGRVSQPCTSLVFQNSLFAFLCLQFVLFLVSFHQIVSKSFINRLDRPPKHKICWLESHSPAVISWMLQVRPITT